MKASLLIAALLLPLLGGAGRASAAGTIAQPSPAWPDEKALEAARRRARAAFEQVPAGAATAPLRPAISPTLATPVPPIAPAGTDVAAIARQHQDVMAGAALPKPVRLLVFVSLSMPKESLKHVAVDAERAGATLILRGFVNGSMKQTMTAVQDILGPTGRAAWEIDPPAFAHYGIHAAPTTVLARHAGNDGNDYAAVAGDVTLAYALDAIAREKPGMAPQAADFRRRLGE